MAIRALPSAIKAWVYSRRVVKVPSDSMYFYVKMSAGIPRVSRLDAPRNRLFANDERIWGRFVRIAMDIALYRRARIEMLSIRALRMRSSVLLALS